MHRCSLSTVDSHPDSFDLRSEIDESGYRSSISDFVKSSKFNRRNVSNFDIVAY